MMRLCISFDFEWQDALEASHTCEPLLNLLSSFIFVLALVDLSVSTFGSVTK